MLKFIQSLVCALATTFASVSHGVGLDEIVESALSHPSLKLSRSQSVVAGYDLEAAKWAQFPTLSYESFSKDKLADSTSVKLEQPIWSGGAIDAGIEGAEYSYKAADAAILEARLKAVRNVGSAYVELSRANEQLQETRENIAKLQELEKTIKNRVDAKISPKSEWITVYARISQAESQADQIKGAIARLKTKIAELTDIQIDTTNRLSCELPMYVKDSDLQANAEKYSPTLLRLDLQKSANQAGVDKAKAEFYPRVTVGIENVKDNAFSLDGDPSAFVALRYTLSDGLSANSNLASAREKVATAAHEYEISRRALVEEVQTLLERYRASENQVRPLYALVESNWLLIDSFLAQYKVGNKSWLDVVNAQREYYQSVMSLIDALGDRCAAAFDLQTLSGQTFVAESKS